VQAFIQELPTGMGQKYALIVGVGVPPKESPNLDIHPTLDLVMAVSGQVRLFPQENIVSLVNEAATKGAIVKALTSLEMMVRDKDMVVFLFCWSWYLTTKHK